MVENRRAHQLHENIYELEAPTGAAWKDFYEIVPRDREIEHVYPVAGGNRVQIMLRRRPTPEYDLTEARSMGKEAVLALTFTQFIFMIEARGETLQILAKAHNAFGQKILDGIVYVNPLKFQELAPNAFELVKALLEELDK